MPGHGNTVPGRCGMTEPDASDPRSVSGGQELNHFGGQKDIWPAVVGGGRGAEKWRPDVAAISLEQREAEG